MTKRKTTNSKILFLLLISYFLFLIPSLYALTLDETITSLKTIAPNQAVQFRWDPLFRDGVFNFGDHYGTFSVAKDKGETGFLLFNNRELFNVPLPYNDKGSLVFPDSFVSTLKSTFTRFHENDISRFRVAAIIIDPGHGGRDPGTIGTISVNGKNQKINEKDIVLDVGLALRDKLIQKYPDKRILMTRDSDIYRTLDYRAEMANAVTVRENESVIFISIHVNWGSKSSARGYEVWHITSGQKRSLLDKNQQTYSSDINAILNQMLNEEFTSESILLADEIIKGFYNNFGTSLPSRGRKANDWFVVRNSRMPAVLVELGFISNKQDAALMTSKDGLQKMTNSLYNGINNFIGIFER